MQENKIIAPSKEVFSSPLYSKDLAPVPLDKKTWTTFDMAAIWVGMAVCIPTYILASYMIKSGISWYIALIIIGLANLIITIPMILNGHAGVKYGIPFPVLGRASFGTKGIHIPAVVRAIVACGWFGVQTWIGGLAIYAIWNAISGSLDPNPNGLNFGEFISFSIFWFINMYFIWQGTNSIKWLEGFSAPILIIIGIALIFWGTNEAGGFNVVLDKGVQLQTPTAIIKKSGDKYNLHLNPLKSKDDNIKANLFQVTVDNKKSDWLTISKLMVPIHIALLFPDMSISDQSKVSVQFQVDNGSIIKSSIVSASFENQKTTGSQSIMSHLIWLTAMVGFWATMSLSIADITRYASTQKIQIKGQLIGLPGTMMLYSFVGVFVTFAATLNFNDILVNDDVPWDPVSLLSRFNSPIIVVISQIFMIIATLSTNIAANVIAPSNAFSNLFPKQISFRTGGIITAIIGIIICPWWLLNEISSILIFISGLLGPVLGILVCDYFLIRRKKLELTELYKTGGIYSYSGGFNMKAMISLAVGVLLALAGYWIPTVEFLYSLSWFTGFIISFALYYFLMKEKQN